MFPHEEFRPEYEKYETVKSRRGWLNLISGVRCP